MPHLSHLPAAWQNRLRIPLIAAPMFIVSQPKLVLACCQNGILGTFPALNQRTTAGFVEWLEQLTQTLTPNDAPFGVNLIVHKSNTRLHADLAQIVKYRVPLVITSLGAVSDVVDAVHSYGGLVFHDVIGTRHAEKAIQAGVDGLIPVAAGAGGHAGTTHPFVLVQEMRQLFQGFIALSGCMNGGADIAAARALGADFGYMGTRLIATQEANAEDNYKKMVVNSQSKDIVYTKEISGIHANFLRESIIKAGLNPDNLPKHGAIDLGLELSESKAWKDIWSAGQGVSGIHDVPTVAELSTRLLTEYQAAQNRL